MQAERDLLYEEAEMQKSLKQLDGEMAAIREEVAQIHSESRHTINTRYQTDWKPTVSHAHRSYSCTRKHLAARSTRDSSLAAGSPGESFEEPTGACRHEADRLHQVQGRKGAAGVC